jgi:hypothetical protein
MNADSLLDNPVLLAVAGTLALLLLYFSIRFVAPGLLLQFRLRRASRALKKHPGTDELNRIFESDPGLRHLWSEFRETLHPQKEERDGELVTVALRATTPSELFFNPTNVVDGRVAADFFKHLPGLFTGIGILGTFAGLITGLEAFQTTVPEEMPSQVTTLLKSVREAFYVSASAIGLAMLVTFLEKLILTHLYHLTDTIAKQLDSFFTLGAGEEYLSRLVIASEDSATQSKILKDSMVGDLKVILQEMSDRQISAQTLSSEALGRQITGGIESSLQGPLRHLGDVVAKASGDQSATASELLKDVMVSFGAKLNDLFGGQISGIQQLNQRSAEALQEAVSALNILVGRIEDNSLRSTDLMADRIARASEEMERRQSEINHQTQELVANIQQIAASSQAETSQALHQSIDAVRRQMTEMLDAVHVQSATAQQENARREEHLVDRTTGFVTSLGDSLAGLVTQMAASSSQMQLGMASIERITTTSIDKLNSGAATIERGATAFALAGDNAARALSQASTVAQKMTEVSGALTSSSGALQTVLSDYRANREAVVAMLAELRGVIELAKRETSMTQQILDQIESAANKLSSAQQDAEKYLDGVSSVLSEAHGRFSDGLSRTLERANSDFHNKLSSAVGLLSSAIEELEVTVSSITSGRR